MKMKGGEEDLVTFLLKVDMHCRCDGCIKKIREGLASVTNFSGVERTEPKIETGEVKVVGKVKPEKLRRWLHQKINKRVDLITYTAPSLSTMAIQI